MSTEFLITSLIVVLLPSAVFMLMTLIVFVGYGLLANRVRRGIANSPRMISRCQRVFAGLFVALGIKLALAER